MFGQASIKKVGAGEYFITFLTKDGRVHANYWYNGNYICRPMTIRGIADVDGAKQTSIALDSNGMVYILGYNSKNGYPKASKVSLDSDGKEFSGNSKVFGWYNCYITLRNGQIWLWGQDLLNLNNGNDIRSPTLLNSPPGIKFINLVPLTMNNFTLMALGDNGTVWNYVRGNLKPVEVKINSPVLKIAGIGAAMFVVETKDDLLAWGFLGSYLGLTGQIKTPTSIKSQWTKAGCVFPSKELVGNYNTLHIIDANDNMFGAGENIQGEVGNGVEYPNWKSYKPNAYAWNWEHAQLITKPVQIPGKFKNIYTNTSMTFYLYVQDIGDNWYSWGRNKGRVLGNGISLISDFEAMYPNALDIPAPQLVTPLSVNWKVFKNFNPSLPREPICNGGVNQYIKANKTILNGSLSSQQDGQIIKYQWAKVSGPECKIADTLNKITIVSGLTYGKYVFSLTVTNNYGKSNTSYTSVFVLD